MAWSALLLAAFAATGDPAPPLGDWSNATGSVTVRIAECGERLCGTVVAASPEAIADAAAGGTPSLVGTMVLRDFAPAGPGRWRGRAFIPDKGKSGHARLVVRDSAAIDIVGCDPTGILCRKQRWRRVAP